MDKASRRGCKYMTKEIGKRLNLNNLLIMVVSILFFLSSCVDRELVESADYMENAGDSEEYEIVEVPFDPEIDAPTLSLFYIADLYDFSGLLVPPLKNAGIELTLEKYIDFEEREIYVNPDSDKRTDRLVTVYFDPVGRISELRVENIPMEEYQSTATYSSKNLTINYDTGLLTESLMSGDTLIYENSHSVKVYRSDIFGRVVEAVGLSSLSAISKIEEQDSPAELFAKNMRFLGTFNAPSEFSRYGNFIYGEDSSRFTIYSDANPDTPHYEFYFENYRSTSSVFYRPGGARYDWERLETLYQPDSNEPYQAVTRNMDTGEAYEYTNIFQMIYDEKNLRIYYSRYIEGDRGEILETHFIEK
jgi:hypothetical protein